MDIRRLSHSTRRTPAQPQTVAALLARGRRRLQRARLHYGHGTDNPGDEAAALLAFALGLDRPLEEKDLARRVPQSRAGKFAALLQRRIEERVPAVYLTGRCWFAGVPFFVDQRVLVPRSPIAELIEARFAPWVEPERVRRILDVGTGSGCIALASALAFPRARVDAVDISAAALQVARINRRQLGLSRRVRLLQSSHFEALEGQRYDIIVSNPPYVGAAEMRGLPAEYRHEPELGLASGPDGMDAVRVLLREAADHLAPSGVLVVEVGNTEAAVRRAYPRLPFVWLQFERGGGGVFVLTAEQLARAAGG
ncbi:MAG: 50S ribosomal protein L3 N(5)-glutamine methyltransferase [Steroidobacteraceae bacterium]